jgi:CHAT domain-containing protein
MNKDRGRLFRWLLFLVCTLAGASIPAQEEKAPTRSPVSVQARRQTLSELIGEQVRWRESGNVVELVKTTNRIGQLQLQLRDLNAALAAVRESSFLASQFKDSENQPLLADTLILSARVQLYNNSNQAALQLLDGAGEISRKVGYRRGEAQSFAESGLAYFQMSKLPEAEKSNNDALRIWRELQDQHGEAKTLTNQGETYMLMDRAAEATEVLSRAATIWRTLNEPMELATTLLDLNFLAIRQGQWQKALSFLSEAQGLAIDNEAEPFLAAQIAMSFGEVYEAYWQLETALTYFKESLTFYRDGAHDISGVIDASSKAGRVQARLGNNDEALSQIEQALHLAEEMGNELLIGLCREDLGRILLLAGSYEEAHQQLLKSTVYYQRTGNRRAWARAQTFLGQTEYSQGKLAQATRSYQKALEVFQDIQDYSNEAALSFGLGKLELEQGRLREAGDRLKRSIALTEQLRENAASKDLRSSYLASVHDRYETYVGWLMQLDAEQPGQGFDIKAFEASESGRARSLLDSLRDYQREFRQVANPALLLDEEKLQKEEQQLLDERSKLQNEVSSHQTREKVENELRQTRSRYETLEAQINSTAKFKNLMRPAPLGVEEIRKQVTDANTFLLEYSLGTQQSYLWLITPDGLTTYVLPGKGIIEAAARKLADLLAQRPSGPEKEAELEVAIIEMSRLVLAPVAGKLNSSRLIIVPDGILEYIPFQILTTSSGVYEPLVAQFAVVNSPSASTLAALRQETRTENSPTKLLAAFGDPVLSLSFSNNLSATRGQKVGTDRQTDIDGTPEEAQDPDELPRLLFAKRELNELRKLVAPDELVIYSDYAATRENLRQIDLSQFRILHLATHGRINTTQPELSGLVLSLFDREGRPVTGFFGLSDIYNLSAQIDLVVLSACSTALGKEVRGEGLVGLTRGFMYAGASSVVASLWEVDDQATAALMKEFYTNVLQRGMTPASGLRAAQNSIRQQPQWRSPYYWAAFTLQGEFNQVIKPARIHSVSKQQQIFLAFLVFMVLAAAGWYLHSRASTGESG